MIVSGSTDTTIKLWSLKSGELLYTLTGHSGAMISLAFSPDGQMLASSSKDGTIQLWQLQPEQLQPEGDLPVKRLHTLPGRGRIVFSPDGKTLICGCENGLIKVWQQTSWDEGDRPVGM
jgi:WD40 repeat protein